MFVPRIFGCASVVFLFYAGGKEEVVISLILLVAWKLKNSIILMFVKLKVINNLKLTLSMFKSMH